jgi:D-alanyl-D-alanine carboxypeptidase (penicillin-binding protein 5/6)
MALTSGPAVARDAIAPPAVTATSVYVLNADTGAPLYRKNETNPTISLSLTKLVTAEVMMQRLGDRLSETVTVTPAYIAKGSSAGLRKGDIWSLTALLYGMLLVSGNDAALAIADHAGRAILAEENKTGNASKRFVQEMQALAVKLGAKQTQFADPYGLSPANVSTARDLALIGASAFRDQRLLPFWSCARRTLDIAGPNPRIVTLNSTVELLGEDHILGAKTGSHVGKSIYHLAVGWRAPNGQTIVAIVLGSPSNAARYADMRAILAALPQDFPELSAPSPVSGVPASGACR